MLREDGFLKLYFSPLQKLSTTIKLYEGEKEVGAFALNCGVLETWKDSIPLNESVASGKLKVVVGENLLG